MSRPGLRSAGKVHRSCLRLTAPLLTLAAIAVLSTAMVAGAADQQPAAPNIPEFKPQWNEIAVPAPRPLGRHVHTFTFDPIRRRAIVFGGFEGGAPYGDTWMLALDGEPVWTLLPPGSSPSPRRGHSMIYDPVRDRMVLFGGYDGSFRNDTWQLSTDALPQWTQLVTTGSPPTSNWHSAIYDPVRDAMVVFAGENEYTNERNDTWVLSFASMTWSELEPSGPLPPVRAGHTAVYDPFEDRMIVFGGRPGFLNDVWSLSLANPEWTLHVPAGALPESREGSPGIYDPIEKRLIIFGGWDGSTTRNDTWVFSLVTSTWQMLETAGIPPIRSGAAGIYDPLMDRMIVFGGNSSSARNDTWALRWLKRPARPAIDPVAADRTPGAAAPLELFAPAPNPSVAAALIRFSLPAAGAVRLDVFDVSGRRVRSLVDDVRDAGAYEARWSGDGADGRPIAAGVYFLRLDSPSGIVVRRISRLSR